jgi:hypothetical protein
MSVTYVELLHHSFLTIGKLQWKCLALLRHCTPNSQGPTSEVICFPLIHLPSVPTRQLPTKILFASLAKKGPHRGSQNRAVRPRAQKNSWRPRAGPCAAGSYRGRRQHAATRSRHPGPACKRAQLTVSLFYDDATDVGLHFHCAVGSRGAAVRVYFLEISVNPRKFAPNSMKSAGFHNLFIFMFFLGPAFWGRRCGSPAPKFWEGLPAPRKRPIRRPAGHHFGGAGGDALITTHGQ